MVYYSSIYSWKALLDFYAVFVRQIELGNWSWKNDLSDLEVPLSKQVKPDFNNTKKASYNVKKGCSIRQLFRRTNVLNHYFIVLVSGVEGPSCHCAYVCRNRNGHHNKEHRT